MKKIFLSALLLLGTLGASAQHAQGSFTIQPKLGLNIASVTSSEGADPRFALAVGAEGEYQVTDMVSVSGALLYSMQGIKASVADVSETIKLDYINIPIVANVYVAKGLAVKLGVQPGFMINDKVKVSTDGVTAEVGMVEAMRQAGMDVKLNKFDVSVPVGLSYEFSNVVLDARYNWGVTKIVKGEKGNNSVFQITCGYKFEL